MTTSNRKAIHQKNSRIFQQIMNAPTAGTLFGHYELLEELGEGGMGKVFKATDTRLDRMVAIKIPLFTKNDDSQSEEDVEGLIHRFIREAKLAAKIKHPNVCAIHTFGEIDGNHYLDLEYIEGVDLAKYLRKRGGKLSPIEAADIIAKVASGMHALHKKDVIHRDLKPQNLMLDRERQPVILDFGLAKGIDDTELCLTGRGFVGTVRYASPEQLNPKEKHLRDQPTTDIYSLGTILFELACGKFADDGEDFFAVYDSKWNPSPLLVEVNPDIPQELSDICAKMLSVSAENRQTSMATVARELRKFRDKLLLKSTDRDLPLLGPVDEVIDRSEQPESGSDGPGPDPDGPSDFGSMFIPAEDLIGLDEANGDGVHTPDGAISDTKSNTGPLEESKNNGGFKRPKRRLAAKFAKPYSNQRLLNQVKTSRSHVIITGHVEDHFLVDLYHGSRTLEEALQLYALDAGYQVIAEIDHALEIKFPIQGLDTSIKALRKVGRVKDLLDTAKSAFIVFRFPQQQISPKSKLIKNLKKALTELVGWDRKADTSIPDQVVFVVPESMIKDFNTIVSECGQRSPPKIDIGLPDLDELRCFFERVSLRKNMIGDVGPLAEYATKWKKSLCEVEMDLTKFLNQQPDSNDLSKLYRSTQY